MTMDNLIKILATIAVIGIIIYYALESKHQREQKSKNKVKKILSEKQEGKEIKSKIKQRPEIK